LRRSLMSTLFPYTTLFRSEGYGWITIDKNVDPITASEKDILENKYDLNIQPLEPAQTPRSLSDTDFAFVNGNYALASGLKLEERSEEHTSELQSRENLVCR